jgi:hypothetical protein
LVVLYHRKAKANKLTEEKASGPVMDSDIRLEDGKPSSQANWHARTTLGSSVKNCEVCLFPTTLFLTACGHVLHPECLLKWGKSHNGCPGCGQQLRRKEHFLFCRVCEEQEQGVSYDRMVEIVKSEKTTEETICSDCRSKVRET